MIYTIKIDDSTPKAENFINFLKFLKKDFSFIEIEYDESLKSIEANIDVELSRRFKLFDEDSSGKDWEILRKELI
jgi:hypothetical protein